MPSPIDRIRVHRVFVEPADMLISILETLLCAVCRNATALPRLTTFCEGADGHVADGVLTCTSCETWYPIQDGLLELVVPALVDDAELRRFRERFSGELAASAIGGVAPPPGLRSSDEGEAAVGGLIVFEVEKLAPYAATP